MEKQLEKNSHIAIVPSEKYYNDYRQSVPSNRGARYEGSMISTILSQSGMSFSNIAVVLLDRHDNEFIPLPLKGCTHYVISTEEDYLSFYRWITNQPQVAATPLGTLRKLSAEEVIDSDGKHETEKFSELCQDLFPLMRENKRIFDSFGPNSSAEATAPLRTNFSVWEQKKKDSIVPNNKIMRSRINLSYDDIPMKYRSAFDKLLSHIDAFEVHVSKDGAWYRNDQFPTEIVDIVKSHIKHDKMGA